VLAVIRIRPCTSAVPAIITSYGPIGVPARADVARGRNKRNTGRGAREQVPWCNGVESHTRDARVCVPFRSRHLHCAGCMPRCATPLRRTAMITHPHIAARFLTRIETDVLLESIVCESFRALTLTTPTVGPKWISPSRAWSPPRSCDSTPNHLKMLAEKDPDHQPEFKDADIRLSVPRSIRVLRRLLSSARQHGNRKCLGFQIRRS
jgi:hypothetical protein